MKIAWFCIPAHGHTNPTLGLVKALTDAGHTVCYFSFEMFRDKIEEAGVLFIPCDAYDFEMKDKENADRVLLMSAALTAANASGCAVTMPKSR